MRERKIKMTPAEVQNFVNEASKCDFDIDISYNHYTVDAKSILGVMGLDFRSILTLQYAGHNDEFENSLIIPTSFPHKIIRFLVSLFYVL